VNNKKELTFLDSEKNQIRVRKVFYLALVALLIAEMFIHKHPHFEWETAHGFYAVYGFIACVALIFIAKLLRLVVKRREDYYD
jgi:hypothetical protein